LWRRSLVRAAGRSNAPRARLAFDLLLARRPGLPGGPGRGLAERTGRASPRLADGSRAAYYCERDGPHVRRRSPFARRRCPERVGSACRARAGIRGLRRRSALQRRTLAPATLRRARRRAWTRGSLGGRLRRRRVDRRLIPRAQPPA